MINAMAINHAAELPNELKIPVCITTPLELTTSFTGARPTNTVTTIPSKVVPPIGKGFVIHPTIVATKIANISHA